MLPQKTLDSISSLLRVPAPDLKAAIDAKEEVEIKDFDATKLESFTKDELATRDTNMKTASKNEGIGVGKELVIKDLKTTTGLEITGKDPSAFITAYKEKVLAEAKVPANAQIQELQSQITTLKATITTTEQATASAKAEADMARFEASMVTNMPERNSMLSDQDYLLLAKTRIIPHTENGTTIYKDAAGKDYRDPKTGAALDLKTTLTSVFDANPSWKPTAADPTKGGRGGGNSGAGGAGAGGAAGTPTKYSQAVKIWQEQGKHINSSEFALYVGKLQQDNKEFDMDTSNVVSSE